MKKTITLGLLFLIALAASVAANPILDAIGDQTGSEDTLLTFAVTNSAPDDGSSTYAINPVLTGATFTKDSDTQATFSWTPDLTQAGTYVINFSVSDSNSTSSELITIDIAETNAAPTITSTPVTTATVGVAYTYDVDATDIDVSDTLTYSLISFPSGMTIDSTTGVISWTPTGAGSENVVVSVTDGSDSGTQPFTITVSNPVDLTLTASTTSFSLEPGDDFSTTLTIENTGTVDVTGVTLNSAGLSDFSIVFDPAGPFDIAVGSDQTITLTGTGDEGWDLKHDPTVTGTITASDGTVSDSVVLTFEGENMLEITDLDIKFDGDKESNLDDGDDVKDVKPGDILEISGEIKNLFSSSSNIEIDDVTILITLEDFDEDGDDIDDEVDIGKIKENKKENFDLEFDVPFNIDEDDYNMVIEVEGDDDNGATHYIRWELTIEVERKSHEVKITRASFDRDSISCDRQANLNVRITNTGSNTEEEVVIEIESDELDISERVTDIELDDDPDDDENDYSKSFRLNVDDNERAGTYDVVVTVYLDRDDLETVETVTLTVQSCEADDDEPTVVIQPPTTPPTTTPSTPTTPTVTTPTVSAKPPTTYQKGDGSTFTESTAYVVLLVVAVIVLLAVVIYLIVQAFRK